YNLYWTEFLDIVAPQIIEIHARLDEKARGLRVLDLCCGTGRLSGHFLKAGIGVVGIDLSPDMITVAQRRNQEEIDRGNASFEVGNAVDFTLDRQVGMVVSTFDSLNHLASVDELKSCFHQVYTALSPGGLFIFDLNSEKGLKKWEFVDFEDHGDTIFIMHGKYNQKDKKAYTRVYGFFREEGTEMYRKFDETMSNTVYDYLKVKEVLEETGFTDVRNTKELDLSEVIMSPDEEDRVFFIAKKP
ncbi:MAG: class I SAM-dependent DNA methyltransferase, partial [Candidatus Kariarchaeaceae archaeon]